MVSIPGRAKGESAQIRAGRNYRDTYREYGNKSFPSRHLKESWPPDHLASNVLDWDSVHCVGNNIPNRNKTGNMNSVWHPFKIAMPAAIVLTLIVNLTARG